MQTYMHMLNTLDRLPPDVLVKPEVVHEYGCSAGDGTALLAGYFGCNAVGYDLYDDLNIEREWDDLESENVRFGIRNIVDPNGNADMIFVLHLLEGPERYGVYGRQADIVDSLLSRCAVLILAVHPTDRYGKHHLSWVPTGRLLFYRWYKQCCSACGTREEVVMAIKGKL